MDVDPQDPGQHPPDEDQKWTRALEESSITTTQLHLLHFMPRAILIEPWARQGDLGFIFAQRGVGKTWLGMHLAHCLADGRDFGPWKVYGQNNVLYMDGEMPIADVQYRDHLLGQPTERLSYINHERLFELTSRTLNLSDATLQSNIINFCKQEGFNVLLLDNLSTLVSGIDENKAIEWEKILPWLLQLRRAQITVIFIHHAGRSGDHMRGHSKREDPSAWIINLKFPKNDPEYDVDGAHFVSSFEKYRNAPQRPKDLEWLFTPLANGSELIVRHDECNHIDVFVDLVATGLDQCGDIAQEMEISKATVTRLAQKAVQLGLITVKGRKYVITTSKHRTYNPSDDEI